MQGMSRLGSAALSIALVAIIALASYADVLLIAAAVVVAQVLIASAPSLADGRGRSVPTPRFVPAMTGGLIATVLALYPQILQKDDGDSDVLGFVDTGVIAGIVPAVAATVFVALVAQMLRRDGRRELTASTAYAVSLGVAAALASGWIGGSQSLGGEAVVVIGAAGLAAGLLVWTLPLHRVVSADRIVAGSAAVLAGAAAGAVAALLVDSIVTWLFGIAVGSTVALFAVLGQVFGRAWVSGRTHASVGWAFPGAMSVALVGPVVYVSGQLVAAAL